MQSAVTPDSERVQIAPLQVQFALLPADRWRGIQVGEFEQRQLRAIREELDHAHAVRVAPAVAAKPASPVQKLRVGR